MDGLFHGSNPIFQWMIWGGREIPTIFGSTSMYRTASVNSGRVRSWLINLGCADPRRPNGPLGGFPKGRLQGGKRRLEQVSRWWQLKYFWNFHPDPWGRFQF